jgi:RNA polymerase sigma-70 factor (ECF subfamily)
MTSDVSSTTTDDDPVTAAIKDVAVQSRLLAAARAVLFRHLAGLTTTERAERAGEVVQDAVCRALRKKSEFDPSRDVVNWLVGFVRNVAREHAKEYFGSGGPTGPPGDRPRLEDLAVDHARPLDDAVAGRLDAAQWLDLLPPQDGEILRLKYADDWTFEEIGERMGMNVNAVRVRAYRARQRLRELGGIAGEDRP